MHDICTKYYHCERGATFVEYGFILLFIVIVIFVSVGLVGETTTGHFESIEDSFPDN